MNFGPRKIVISIAAIPAISICAAVDRRSEPIVADLAATPAVIARPRRAGAPSARR